MWLCKCDCGNIKKVRTNHLKFGSIKSCGCLLLLGNPKHNMCGTKIYNVYKSMRERCFNKNDKNYRHYGGRGIKICDEWLDKENGFMNFYNWAIKNGYKKGLTLDRINVDGNYSPSNCRWTTMKEQSNNRRNNNYITYNGETHTLTQWSEILNIKYGTLQNRIQVQKKSNDMIFEKSTTKKRIRQYDLLGNFIKEWESITEIHKELNYCVGNISRCCQNKYKTAYGYIWRYAEYDFNRS